ncbi:melanoma-associated antigen 8-like [Zalophus californianus]|uniref:Melanoma-associated antigen 8-like n=1 Tax=Zalophus californianus TaxID=9704 RepID=A0A6P9F786_ZALCA|nr:melanoma-associated antigen 8-like [Zalophus californianus]XP_035581307.1 melanoma-associated antigen 8-like [Zalophus californianus]XP_035581308.1 melanoma-associated antigen 8-like [Zalophus californianus]XP_035581309.1 melanoma-associated antigen 8-like [Zalophus californianus]
MPLGQRGELWKLEEDPGPAQGLVEAQLAGAGEEEVPRAPSSFSASASSQSEATSGSCSALFLVPSEEGSAAGFQRRPQSSLSARPSPTAQAATACSQPDQGSSSSDEEGTSPFVEPEEPQPGLQNLLQGKLAELVEFLLLKYHTKEPTSQAEMLEIVGKDAQDAFPVILGQASECMQLVFGMDVKEVDPSDHSYVLVPVLGLTYDGMLSGEEGVPKTGLLVVLLGVILLHGDHAPEEEVWETLGVMGVYAGQEHVIYGEPRELLTKVWVQEGYVEYRQVPGSDPARYEFLWGPRAHAETSKLQMLEYLLRVRCGQPASSLALSEEAVRDEEEGA